MTKDNNCIDPLEPLDCADKLAKLTELFIDLKKIDSHMNSLQIGELVNKVLLMNERIRFQKALHDLEHKVFCGQMKIPIGQLISRIDNIEQDVSTTK